jgi:hypothetical protein
VILFLREKCIASWPDGSYRMGLGRPYYLVLSKKRPSTFMSPTISTFTSVFSSLILAEVMQQAGIRAFVGKLSMDLSSRPTYMEASAEKAIESAKSFVIKCRALVAHLPAHLRFVEPVVTPRFVPTCSDELLCGLGRLSESHSIRIQSHLAEAKDQVEWVRRERNMEDIEVFEKVGRVFKSQCLRRPRLTNAEPPPDKPHRASSLYVSG